MPIQQCPACNRPTARVLAAPSEYALVNYYRCDACGHVWTTNKDTGDLAQHITPLAEARHIGR